MKRRIGIARLAALVLAGIAFFACRAWAGPADEALKNGIEYSQQGDNDGAIAEFNKAIAADPASADAYYNRGFVYYKKGRFEEAVADCTKAIELNPAAEDAYYNRALAYYKQGDFDEAIADYNKVMQMNPGASDALYGRGLCYYKKNDIKQAIADYDKVIAMRPDFPLAYSARAVAYFSKHDYGRTLADVNKAIAIGFRTRPLKRFAGAVARENGAATATVEKAPAAVPAAGQTYTAPPARSHAKPAAWAARRKMIRVRIYTLTAFSIICLVAIFILLRSKKP